MPEDAFDERVAAIYDETCAARFDPAVLVPTVDALAELAGPGGRALELAVGTGRVALPLSQRGVQVHGIELSEPMVRRLLAKEGSDAIEVTIGDMATSRVPSQFDLVYLVYSTITNLTTQAEQVQCFRNAAAHLRPGGCFVIEAGVPDLRRLPPGERLRAFEATPSHLGVDEYDVAAQLLTSHHQWLFDGRVDAASTRHRFVWPSELDLMAQLAGMTLRERWSDWNRAPFTSESTGHVSVWATVPPTRPPPSPSQASPTQAPSAPAGSTRVPPPQPAGPVAGASTHPGSWAPASRRSPRCRWRSWA